MPAFIRTLPARIRCSSTPASIATIRCSCRVRRRRSWSDSAPRASSSPPISCATVRQAVMAWSQRLTERPGGAPGVFELASTLIGSGGMGISAGQAAQLVAQGVHEANERMAGRGWPVVSHLHFVELYLDRASDVWRALQVPAAAAPGEFVVTEPVTSGPGALPRLLDSGYRGADYDLMSAADTAREERRGPDRLHPRHQACAQRGASAGDAKSPAAKAVGGRRASRSPATAASRPHAVQATDADRNGAVSRRHDRDADRSRWRYRGHSVGNARERDNRRFRSASLGDSHQAVAQAAHRGLSRTGGPTRVPMRASW